jgi:hypothetical protein
VDVYGSLWKWEWTVEKEFENLSCEDVVVRRKAAKKISKHSRHSVFSTSILSLSLSICLSFISGVSVIFKDFSSHFNDFMGEPRKGRLRNAMGEKGGIVGLVEHAMSSREDMSVRRHCMRALKNLALNSEYCIIRKVFVPLPLPFFVVTFGIAMGVPDLNGFNSRVGFLVWQCISHKK